VTFGIWLEQSSGHIHIGNSDGRTALSTVSNTKGSERSHPDLYKVLRALLVSAGRWPNAPARRTRVTWYGFEDRPEVFRALVEAGQAEHDHLGDDMYCPCYLAGWQASRASDGLG
jgi:hypothetical protein